MDAQSAVLFANPRVKLAGYLEHEQEIRNACQIIFGRVLPPEDFVELIAALDGSELSITATKAENEIELRLGYSWFNGTCDYLLYLDPESSKRVVEFDSIALLTEAPEFLETRLFARQVTNFRKFAIDEIRLWAAGFAKHPGAMGGYYVWPRLGFSMDLGGFGSRLAQAGFTDADNTLELFSQKGGPEWWRDNGHEAGAVFDLSENSLCVLALQSYLDERGLMSMDEVTIKNKIKLENRNSKIEVTFVNLAELTLIADKSNDLKIAHPPRYDPQRDEPAFQRAWRKVAAARARGEAAAAPKLPPGGIRLRGSRSNSK